MSLPTTTIPKGSLILITGATGFIASHIALKFLELEFKVRGTVRDLSKASWLEKELFSSYAAKGAFELVAVPDMATENAFDSAVKGVSAVVHVATINTWDSNPHNVIPQTVAGVINVLKAAEKESTIKQFVFTSSLAAAAMPIPDTKFHVDEHTWNDVAVQMAWAPPPYDPSRAMLTYGASKVEAEKAVWKFVEDNKPGFTVNAVHPVTTFGQILNKNQPGSTADWVLQLYRGETEQLLQLKALDYVNVRDIAVLHVAAVLDPDLKNRRIHAWAKPFNWNDVLAIMRKLRPNHKFVDDLPGLGQFLGTVDDSLGLELLEKWAGQQGWTSLEQGIRENLEGVE